MSKSLNILNELTQLNKDDPGYNRKRMVLMVQYLQRYMETYSNQYDYEGYSDFTFISDVLYGLGVAVDPQNHQYADGFDTWKEKLKQFLDNETADGEPLSELST